jgi:hypothetical protein
MGSSHWSLLKLIAAAAAFFDGVLGAPPFSASSVVDKCRPHRHRRFLHRVAAASTNRVVAGFGIEPSRGRVAVAGFRRCIIAERRRLLRRLYRVTLLSDLVVADQCRLL